ncbi:methyltransferase domain-containing protein [Sulfurimonas sp. HSL3-7]|uniref:protein-L-isoaspartate O-methyltransferase family protein n=1 Tax=Sulfonitrofixus jiaomeiensis TaxID=3131938 RepID=UPI0031F7229E
MSRTGMIESLIAEGVLETPSLIKAFERVDRADFVLPPFKEDAYEDCALPIWCEQTISQPYTVAFMLELLQPQPVDRIMDIGSGSGWTTALLASVCQHVDAVERHEELLAFAKGNLAKYPFNNITLHKAGRTLGLKGEHFDKILVSCSADEMPQQLLDQLSPGGTMVIPLQSSIFKVIKNLDGSLQKEEHPGFLFVPLVEDDDYSGLF